MLIWMRNSAFAGAFKFLLLGLLLLAVAGLVLLDIGGFFTGNISQNTVAKGGGVNIGIQEFDRTVRRVLASQGIPPQDAYKLGAIDGILKAEVSNRLFAQEAADMGLVVDDEAVKAQISKLAASIQAGGGSKKEALQQILRQQGISEREFVSGLRGEMANGLLRAAIQPPASLASPLMASALYRFDNETRGADIIVLKNADITGLAKPTEDQLQKYYEANKASYLIPETRRITMATLKSDMLRKNVKIEEADLRADYDKNIAAYTKAPRRKVLQAVFPDEAAAKAAAEDLKSGKVPANASTQDYEEAGLLPEIAKPVFGAKIGDVVGPVKTDLGWHVMQVKGDLPKSVTPFDQVKDKIKTELETASLGDAMYQTGTVIEDRIAGGDKLEDLVTEYGMTTESIGPFKANGLDGNSKDAFKPYGADRDALIASAFDTDEGDIAPVVETADGQFHLVRVDQIVPQSYKDFASVRVELEKQWASEQRTLANKARAQKALDDLNAGKSLKDVASGQKASVQSIASVKRNAAPPAPLTPVTVAKIFTTDKGKGFSIETDAGFVVGTVKTVVLPPAAASDNKDVVALQDLTGRSLSEDSFILFVDKLSADKKIKINQKALDAAYGQPQDVQE